MEYSYTGCDKAVKKYLIEQYKETGVSDFPTAIVREALQDYPDEEEKSYYIESLEPYTNIILATSIGNRIIPENLKMFYAGPSTI